MPLLRTLLLGLYVVVSGFLALYGLNYLVLWVAVRRAPRARPKLAPLSDPPMVTVQLPVFNERYVLMRLLTAVERLDWPRDRLHVQVIDDSTDDTAALGAEWVAGARRRGLDAVHLHRPARTGFKAGALNHGLSLAKGDHVAIFDADFVPPPDFLRRALPALTAGVACVQARWAHLNEDDNLLTKAVALGLDAHFVVEQRVRADHGFILSFNGTACVWRRDVLETLGRWSSDTLAEDLDASCAALLRGWRFAYLEDLAAPAELPVELAGFRRQQFRWAKGSMQNLRKHGRAVLFSGLPMAAKAETLFHFTHYAIHPLMLLFFLLQVALVSTGPLLSWVAPATLIMASAGPVLGFAHAQRVLHPATWARRMLRLAPLTLLGIGISGTNTRAIVEGVLTRSGTFERTPKFGDAGRRGGWRTTAYAPGGGAAFAVDVTLGLAGVIGAWAAWRAGLPEVVPGMVLFTAAYLAVALVEVGALRRGPLSEPRARNL